MFKQTRASCRVNNNVANCSHGGLRRHLRNVAVITSARRFGRRFRTSSELSSSVERGTARNPLREFCEGRVGRGVWKWEHYFDIYERHFSAFVGREISVVEVGVYGGGSLDLWASYFGPESTIHGVDIWPACSEYQRDNIQIHIGDQADRRFWQEFKARVPRVDILIDDGGHEPRQQIVTLEEMLPHLSPGGVFVCEDVHGTENSFFAYVSALMDEMNAFQKRGPTLSAEPTALQKAIRSISVYPYIVVFETNAQPATMFTAPKRGTFV